VFEFAQILPAANQLANLLVERLHADFKLQRARRKPRDALAKRFRQTIRNHLEVQEETRPVTSEKEFQQGPAALEIQVERAIHELELLHPSIQQALESGEQFFEGRLTHRDLEGTQAELAGERTTARCLDIDYPMGNVVLRIKVVRQNQLA